ncbi:unnamed protein product [Ostreobium quekettii]|uniref:Ataxin-10 domain-containing protein n=1 Tax=Ostreobium quekettii TaxID=121088 RepID=A0A8S1J598_9CHLO|nr:unnamed protein product [Ostreobium quekettii]CAD7701394.1 unnamed protein product [Ostreobium quekettii]
MGEDSPVAIDAIAALGYLVHKDASTKAAVRRLGGIPLLVRMLHADAHKPITCYATAALHNLVDGSTRNKQAVRAAGAIPRLVLLMDGDASNPVVEVAVRTIFKLAEKCEENQSDIRRARGLARLIEMQAKGCTKSLSAWVEKTLQTLKMTDREMEDAKVLSFLGKSFQREFDKVRSSNDNLLSEVVSLKELVNGVVGDLMGQLSHQQNVWQKRKRTSSPRLKC